MPERINLETGEWETVPDEPTPERVQTATVNGVLYERQGNGSWVPVTPQASPKTEQRKRDTNLGNGVYQESDTGAYYTFGPGGPLSGAKQYITQSEAKEATDPQQSSGGSGNATAWANYNARIAEMELDRQELEQRIKQDALDYQLSLQKQNFFEEEAIFNRGIGNEQIALQKSDLALQAQGQAQDYQLSVATMSQQREVINAQMQNETAMFNASQQAETSRFNSQMGFQVEQANVAAQQRKQETVQQYSRDIGSLSQDPGDRAALAAYVLANTGYGRAAQTEGQDLRTDESLTGLELALRNREDVMASPDRPFTFNPVSFNPMQAPQLSPLQLPPIPKMQSGQSDGLVNLALTPQEQAQSRLDEATALGKETEGWTVDESGRYSAGNPFANLPKKEAGGVVQGAFIAGDSSDGKENEEVVIPDFPAPGMTTVVPKGKLTAKMKAHMAGMQKMETGGGFTSGVFGGLGSDRTRSQSFLDEVEQRMRSGTPWAQGNLPDLSFESTPGFDPFVSSLLQGLRSSAQGLPVAWQQRQQALLTPPGIRGDQVISRTR
jgi:hypothetical protein